MASSSGPVSVAPHPHLRLEGARRQTGFRRHGFCISLILHRNQKVTVEQSCSCWTTLLDPGKLSQNQNHSGFQSFQTCHYPEPLQGTLSVTPSSPLNCMIFLFCVLILSFEGSCHWLSGPSVGTFWFPDLQLSLQEPKQE